MRSLLSLLILIDFFQIAVYLTLFVLNGISCLIILLAIISCVFKLFVLIIIRQDAPLRFFL